MRETAFLTRGLHISIVDERGEGHSATFHYEGGIVDFVAYLNENKEPIHRKVISFSGEFDEGAVEVAMQWNASYQESVFSFANNINTIEGGSHLSGLPFGAHAGAQQVRARHRRAQGEGRQPQRRGCPRGAHRGDLGKARRTAVRGPDEDQARQPRHRRLRPVDRQRQARRVPRGEPAGRPARDPQGRSAPRRRGGRAQGPRPHPPQVGARELDAAREARRLLGQGPVAGRAVHRRGRLRGRLGSRRTRPQHAGDPAAARKDPQRREEPDRQGAVKRRNPGADHGDRDRGPRRVRHREGALPQGRAADRRRLRTARTSGRWR